MESTDKLVKEHYGIDGLAERIVAGLKAAGTDIRRLTVEDLAPVDEFHIGGRAATQHIISKMALSGSERVLDVGSGIGGPARAIATATGCTVHGIDLTPEYLEAANRLSELTGLNDKVSFQTADALAMPFDDASFDAAVTIHVAMNIADRAGLYREIARVIKPGGTLCIYDVMKVGEAPIDFPVPWAETARTSHLETAEAVSALLEAAGFEVLELEDRSAFARAFFEERAAAAAAANGPSQLGPQLVMGENAPLKIKNLRANVESRRVAPTQILARKSSG